MWDIYNFSRYQAQQGFVRGLNGEEVWIVAVKATYDILEDGELSISADQQPVCLMNEFFGEPGLSSVRYPQDIILMKQKVDIVLNGHAYSPEKNPVNKCQVNLKVGDIIDKTIAVQGDAIWEKTLTGVQYGEITPFQQMPLVYEKAFGGADTLHDSPKKHVISDRNPIGTGSVYHKKNLVGQPVQNLFSPKDKTECIGYGAIPENWAPRVNFAGTYDELWQETRSPLHPADFKPEFFQCAPEDQQGMIQGGEMVELQNLTQNGWLQFKIPQEEFLFETWIKKKKISKKPDLHTVIIEPDIPRLIMVWHMALPCPNQEQFIKGTEIKHRSTTLTKSAI